MCSGSRLFPASQDNNGYFLHHFMVKKYIVLHIIKKFIEISTFSERCNLFNSYCTIFIMLINYSSALSMFFFLDDTVKDTWKVLQM